MNDKSQLCRCSVDLVNGVPRLFINGEAIAPILFFGNTDMGKNVTAQVKLAADNQIHLHSVIYDLHFKNDRPDTNLSESGASDGEIDDLCRCLDMVIDGDSEAKIFLRVKTGAYFKTAPDEWKDELMVFADGSNYPDGSDLCLTSTSSEKWADAVDEKLTKIVRFMRDSEKYAPHLACIHLENCEWFEYGFRESGSDISPIADRRFMQWQRDKYGEAFECVPVPRDLPNNISSEHYKNTLLLEKDEARFIDYFDFINDLVSSRIERFAHTIKRASDGETLVIAFYGYLFELCDCQSGHYNMRKLLRSPYLDGFAGPVSYGDRTASASHGAVGATSAYMTVMDSITRNGKIWFQESDQRTSVNNSPEGGWLPNLKSIEDIANVHIREVNDIKLHGCGLWAMDLMDTGWLMDNAIWSNLAQCKKGYDQLIASKKQLSHFDIVFVVDEAAESVVGQPSFNGISAPLLNTMRYEAYRAGVSFAFAELTDVADGKFSDGRLFIFLNPYRISHETAIRLSTALNGKQSVWMYGFGMTEQDDIRLLTGMDICLTSSGTTALEPIDDEFVPPPEAREVTHRYTPMGSEHIIALYSDGNVASASKGSAIFWGGVSLGRVNIRALARRTGLHVYSESGDVTVTDNEVLCLCATEGGNKTIALSDNTVSVPLKTGECLCINLSEQ